MLWMSSDKIWSVWGGWMWSLPYGMRGRGRPQQTITYLLSFTNHHLLSFLYPLNCSRWQRLGESIAWLPTPPVAEPSGKLGSAPLSHTTTFCRTSSHPQPHSHSLNVVPGLQGWGAPELISYFPPRISLVYGVRDTSSEHLNPSWLSSWLKRSILSLQCLDSLPACVQHSYGKVGIGKP